jgi:hypothetical protein
VRLPCGFCHFKCNIATFVTFSAGARTAENAVLVHICGLLQNSLTWVGVVFLRFCDFLGRLADGEGVPAGAAGSAVSAAAGYAGVAAW